MSNPARQPSPEKINALQKGLNQAITYCNLAPVDRALAIATLRCLNWMCGSQEPELDLMVAKFQEVLKREGL